MLNFSNFKVQKTANERKSVAGVSRGQSFKLKYRKFLSKKDKQENIETLFQISDAKFEEIGLANHGLIEIKDPETKVSYLATVDNEHATMLKRTNKLAEGAEKGRKFKSTKLEDSLREQGLIIDTPENLGKSQLLDLNKVGENVDLGGVTAHAIYEIVKAEDTRTAEEIASDDQDEAQVDTIGADEPQAEVQASEAPVASSDDDF